MHDIDKLKLLTNTKGWDDEGADPIPEKLWDKIEIILDLMSQAGFDSPFVSPCADETVWLSWAIRDKYEFRAEVSSLREINWEFADSDDLFMGDKAIGYNALIKKAEEFFKKYASLALSNLQTQST